MHPRRRFIRRVELTQVALAAALFVAGVVLATADVWLGLGVGAMLGAFNLRAMTGLLERFTTGDATARSMAIAALMVKLLVLAVAVFATLTWLEPHPAALAAGLTLAPLSLLLVSAFARPTATLPEAS